MNNKDETTKLVEGVLNAMMALQQDIAKLAVTGMASGSSQEKHNALAAILALTIGDSHAKDIDVVLEGITGMKATGP